MSVDNIFSLEKENNRILNLLFLNRAVVKNLKFPLAQYIRSVSVN